ncbi:MAG: cell division protein FtsA [Patescibacteria group bacterium]|nr:cell division protein FtsA [Patescibacteria group bacterium]
MTRKITTGIDIGTYQIKVVITELVKDKNGRSFPQIIGRGLCRSRGLRNGYIINKGEVTESILQAVSQAEETANVRIKKAIISIGGEGLEGIRAKGTTVITRADSEITQLDVENAIKESQENAPLLNKKIIHIATYGFSIDNRKVLGDPVGMKGEKLKVESLFIVCLEQHYNNLIQTVEDAQIEVEGDIVASPIAGSCVTLTKTQKIAGCVLADIGAETISIVVFENNLPISLETFPMGSTNITHDIALGLRIDLSEAEKIKHGVMTSTIYSQRELDEIITARLEDIFVLIENHLKKINRNGLLPAGIIISGGGSGMTTINELAKASLNLPSKIANLYFLSSNRDRIQDSTWAVACGLCLAGSTMEEDSFSVPKLAKNIKDRGKKWIKQFFV